MKLMSGTNTQLLQYKSISLPWTWDNTWPLSKHRMTTILITCFGTFVWRDWYCHWGIYSSNGCCRWAEHIPLDKCCKTCPPNAQNLIWVGAVWQNFESIVSFAKLCSNIEKFTTIRTLIVDDLLHLRFAWHSSSYATLVTRLRLQHYKMSGQEPAKPKPQSDCGYFNFSFINNGRLGMCWSYGIMRPW